MTYLVIWDSALEQSLLDYEEYENLEEAQKAVAECHAKYPWNTYRIAQVTETAAGNPDLRPKSGFTISNRIEFVDGTVLENFSGGFDTFNEKPGDTP